MARRAVAARDGRRRPTRTSRATSPFPRMGPGVRRAALRRLLEAGEVVEIEVEGSRGRWLALAPRPAGARARRPATAPRSRGTTLLSPFDSLLWHRERVERLFGFAYRIEVYTPGPKRVHGYYTLPILHDGQLIGRVDAKAHRAERRLAVRGVHFERWFATGGVPAGRRLGRHRAGRGAGRRRGRALVARPLHRRRPRGPRSRRAGTIARAAGPGARRGGRAGARRSAISRRRRRGAASRGRCAVAREGRTGTPRRGRCPSARRGGPTAIARGPPAGLAEDDAARDDPAGNPRARRE